MKKEYVFLQTIHFELQRKPLGIAVKILCLPLAKIGTKSPPEGNGKNFIIFIVTCCIIGEKT